MNKTALITGITGQDGYYLTKLLLNKGYTVFGTIRRKSVVEENNSRLEHLKCPSLILEYADILDRCSIDKMIKMSQPDRIFHLAAQSHVGISFTTPEYTIQTNVKGSFNVIDSAKENKRDAKIYCAGSSEMFGNNIDDDGFQRETTPMNPVSPYGCSKLFMHNLANHYKIAYDMFICSGILFNHESYHRGTNFVTQKIVDGALRIKLGLKDQLELGNLDSKRDWSHASDMVYGMWMMLQQKEPKDYVLSSGKARSIREFCQIVFDKLELGDYNKYVVVNQKYVRPHELNVLKGDCSKAKNELGWKPKYTFDALVEDMIVNHPIYPKIIKE